MFNLLEGDGLIENLYHLLWTKDSIFGTDPFIILPDTIIFKYQKPCYWYFTSKNDNKLKKKSSMKLTTDHIKEVFTRKTSSSGIIAYYIYKKVGKINKFNIDLDNTKAQLLNQISAYNSNLNDYKSNDNLPSNYVIEYFDKKSFDEFLNKKVVYDDGVLQRFENPKGDHNFTIRVTWSPKVCLFEKKTNNKLIYDKRYNIYERAVTYDGEEFHTTLEPIKGNNLPDRLEKIANSVASHVSNVTLERIRVARMVLNLKITSNDTITLLWCSSLRLDNTLDKKTSTSQIELFKECDVAKIKVCPPEKINLFKYSNKGKPLDVIKDSQCVNCDRTVEKKNLFEISFRALIESHNNRKRDKKYFKMYENFQITCTGVDILQFNDTKHAELPEKLKKKSHHRNLLIPKIIYSLFPKMKFDEYSALSKDAVFNTKTAQVCENCYLDITKYCDNASNTENLLRTIGPFHGNIYHTSARKPLTASNFNNLNFNKNKSNNNILNVYLENEKIQKALNKNEKPVTSHQKSRSEHFLTKKVDHFEKVQSVERKQGEKALPVIKFNHKIMNKVIKRNNHLNISHLTELTDISDPNNYRNAQALSKNKNDNN